MSHLLWIEKGRLFCKLSDAEAHLMLVIWHGYQAVLSRAVGWWDLALDLGSFLPTDLTLLCGLGLLSGDREIFFHEKKKKKWAEKSIVSSITWGERGFKSPWSGRQGWLKANKGNHFKLDELRERRSFEALEKSQKVTFLPFNINVRLNPSELIWSMCSWWVQVFKAASVSS